MKAAYKGFFVLVVASLVMVATPGISRAGEMTFMTVINGAQETPPTTSDVTGNGILTFDKKTDTLCYYVSYVGPLASGETAAHIHGPAEPGVAGPVVLPLVPSSNKTACVVVSSPPFDKHDLEKNRYYVNIHSNAFPGGEIRGQILRIK